jgi:hypothetical protein
MKHWFLMIILFLITISCNNWKENPLKVEEATSDESGLFYETNFPEKTAVISFIKSDLWLVGTIDGKFYKSNDKGKTWTNKGTMAEPDRINCFYYTEDSQKRSYVFAGTKKGIYVSMDDGNNWVENYTSASVSGGKPSINSILIRYDKDIKANVLSAFGWNGNNNELFSKDFGISWAVRTFHAGEIKKGLIFTFFGEQGSSYPLLCTANNTEVNSTIYVSNGDDDFSYNLMGVNCITDLVWIPKNIVFVCTTNGLYINTDTKKQFNTWSFTGFEGSDVRALSYIKDGLIYVATDKGAYRSSDFGLSWVKIYIGSDSDKPEKIYYYDNKCFFVMSTGKVFCSLYSDNIGRFLYKPEAASPKNNSEITGSAVVLSWNSRLTTRNNFAVGISTSPDFSDENTETYNQLTKEELKIPGLMLNTKYYWRVKTYNLLGSSDWSDVFTFSTK